MSIQHIADKPKVKETNKFDDEGGQVKVVGSGAIDGSGVRIIEAGQVIARKYRVNSRNKKIN